MYSTYRMQIYNSIKVISYQRLGIAELQKASYRITGKFVRFLSLLDSPASIGPGRKRVLESHQSAPAYTYRYSPTQRLECIRAASNESFKRILLAIWSGSFF